MFLRKHPKIYMYKQIIIVRKDLNMSPGKLAAQVSHASMAFLTSMIRKESEKKRFYRKNEMHNVKLSRNIENGETYFPNPRLERIRKEIVGLDSEPINDIDESAEYFYETNLKFDSDLYEQWIEGAFTKIILEAKNKDELLKAKEMAEALWLKEDEDFFLIRDNCYTELTPEEFDENGVGRTLTCIGFKPMDAEFIDAIGKKYQLLK